MSRSDKVELVSQISEKIKQCQSLILSDFKGLTVEEMTDLRNRLREQSVEMRVIKNRLIRRALSEAGVDALDAELVGNTALAFGVEDPVAPAKTLAAFAKDNEKLVLKGGLLEGRRIGVDEVAALSRMLGRKELLGQMAGDLKQPATKVALAFQAGLVKVAHAMGALGRKLEAEG